MGLFKYALLTTITVFGTAWAGVPVVKTEVAIIGAGAAGLEAADLLRQAGVDHVVLESEDHAGGRVSSRPDVDSMGLTLDEGANLINSIDKTVLRLLNGFEIPYIRRLPPGTDHMQYLINGKHYTQGAAERLLFATNYLVLSQIAWDARLRDNGDVQRERWMVNTSIATYLKKSGADSAFIHLVDSFFWSEYGRRIEDLNLHVLFDYLGVDYEGQHFKFIPYFDEAFQVPGGLGQIVDRLEARNHESIRYSHSVRSIVDAPNQTVLVTAQAPGGPVQIEAKQIIFAAPLHALQSLNVEVAGITPEMLNEAKNMTYARGVKMHLKFSKGFRGLYKFPGIFMTDSGEQIWLSSLGQDGDAGLLTVLTGPLLHHPLEERAFVERVLRQLEKIAPGVSKFYVSFERTDASHSYSGAFRPGEVRDVRLNDIDLPNWFGVGEAPGGDFQGYLEGALLSAKERVSHWLSLRDLATQCETGLHAKPAKKPGRSGIHARVMNY